MNKIISKSEAKALGLKKYFTGEPCKNGHISERRIYGGCIECESERCRARYQENKDKIRKLNRAWYEKNRERVAEYTKARNEANKERISALCKIWYEENKERVIQRTNEWRAKNPLRVRIIEAATKARRRAQKSADCDPPSKVSEWVSATPKVCHWCGVKCAKSFQIDHYHPISKGGKHQVANLVISCSKCNKMKSAKDPYVFAASLGKLF